ncbi:MAG TPA: DoxX family protein [Vicinamibacterales bacterium]|jgi:hypothetical protein|nr:DoxX family protein [Vicinamibacterales bacterium]
MKTRIRTGQVLTAVVLLFMVFDGVIHVLRIAPVVDAFRQLGYPLTTAVPLGVVEIACVALYLVPATRVIAAVLLTAYFGGAVATQVRAGADWFPVVFPALLGALLWTGLSFSDGRVSRLLTAPVA